MKKNFLDRLTAIQSNTNAEVRIDGGNEATHTLFQGLSLDEQIEALQAFCTLWTSDEDGSFEELQKMVPCNRDPRQGYYRFMFTLSGDGQQLRCWNGVPGMVQGREHVDSCACGLMFTVTGKPDVVHKFVKVLTQHRTKLTGGKDGATYWVW